MRIHRASVSAVAKRAEERGVNMVDAFLGLLADSSELRGLRALELSEEAWLPLQAAAAVSFDPGRGVMEAWAPLAGREDDRQELERAWIKARNELRKLTWAFFNLENQLRRTIRMGAGYERVRELEAENELLRSRLGCAPDGNAPSLGGALTQAPVAIQAPVVGGSGGQADAGAIVVMLDHLPSHYRVNDTFMARRGGALRRADGSPAEAGDSALVTNDRLTRLNGVYVVVDPGSRDVPWVLRRGSGHAGMSTLADAIGAADMGSIVDSVMRAANAESGSVSGAIDHMVSNVGRIISDMVYSEVPTYVQETPIGAIDGTNRVFSLSRQPLYEIDLSLDGVIMSPGFHYALDGQILTYQASLQPKPGQFHQVRYTTSSIRQERPGA